MPIDQNELLQLLAQLQGGPSSQGVIAPTSGLQEPSLSGLQLGEQGQGFGGGGSLLGGTGRGGGGAGGGAGLDLLSLLLAAGPQAQVTGVGGEGGGVLGGGGGGGTIGQPGGGTIGQPPSGPTLPSPPTLGPPPPTPTFGAGGQLPPPPETGGVPPPGVPPPDAPDLPRAFPFFFPPGLPPHHSLVDPNQVIKAGGLTTLPKLGGLFGLMKLLGAVNPPTSSPVPPVFGPGGAPSIPGELGPAGGTVPLPPESLPPVTPGGAEPPLPNLVGPPPVFGPGGAPPVPGEFGPAGGTVTPTPPPAVTPGGVEPPPAPPDVPTEPGGGALPADFPGSEFIGKLGGAATVGQGIAKLFGGGTGTQRGVGGAQGALGLLSLFDPEPISKIFLTALGTVLGLIGGGRSNDFTAAQTEAALRQTGASVRHRGPLEQLVFQRALDRTLFQNIGQFDPTVGPAPFGALPTTTPSGAPLSATVANQLLTLLRDPKGVLSPTDITGILSGASPDDALSLLTAINEQRRLRTYAGLPTLAAPPPSIETAIAGPNESPLLQALRRRLQPPTVDSNAVASA